MPLLTELARDTKKKKALYLSVNVFSTKALIGDTIFTFPTGDGTAILRGHPSHGKVQPLRQYLRFSVIFFKTLSIGPVRGIKPAIPTTSRSADWANPATVIESTWQDGHIAGQNSTIVFAVIGENSIYAHFISLPQG